MTSPLGLERDKTAVLLMDYQRDIVEHYPEPDRNGLLARAGAVLEGARRHAMRVVYVVVRFRENYPEIGPRDLGRQRIKESGRLVEGTSGAEIMPAVAPKPGDVVITKRRTGAFSATDLETVLDAQGIDTLVLMGVSTSGCVLTTVRSAADMGYRLVVLSDCCMDRDEEVHRVLTERVFPRQATVVTSVDFLEALGDT